MSKGDTAYQFQGDESDYKRLFYSRPDQAFFKSVTIQAGYGVVKAGTALSLNVSAAGNVGKYVPYAPTAPSSADVYQIGGAFLVADAATNVQYVTMDDSYKFSVADDIIIYDANTATTSAENLGAITAIDRTTYTHMAKITTTSSISSAFTVAQSACIHVECGATSANGYSDCAGICGSTVDTGIGEDAKGAVTNMIIKNAMLYTGLCTNVDAAAIVDIGAAESGQYLVF